MASDMMSLDEARGRVRSEAQRHPHGLVRLWVEHHEPQRSGWRMLNAVDAVEHLRNGSGSFTAPTAPEEARKPAPAPSVQPKPAEPVEVPADGLTAEQLSAMPFETLRSLAVEAGVQATRRKRTEIEADLVGYEPSGGAV